MNVQICSREEMETLLEAGLPEHTAVISFADEPDCDYRPLGFSATGNAVFQVCVPDIWFDELADEGLSYDAFFPEADALADFIREAEKTGCDFICQCEHGESRSAACAAAILQFFEKDGIRIFADFRYSPNQMIYRKVYEALERGGGRNVSDNR
jgi:predicted protein tyrosine phosphatase